MKNSGAAGSNNEALGEKRSVNIRNLTLLVITPDYPDEKNRYIGSLYVKDQVEYLKSFFKQIIVICPILVSFKIMPNDRYCTDYQYDNISVYYPRCFFIPRIVKADE